MLTYVTCYGKSSFWVSLNSFSFSASFYTTYSRAYLGSTSSFSSPRLSYCFYSSGVTYG